MTSKRLYATLVILFLCSMALFSQNRRLTSDGKIEHIPNDMSFINNPVTDRNSKKCALIKVTVLNELRYPLTLDVGSGYTVEKTEDKGNGQVWFYVPAEDIRNLEFLSKEVAPLKIPVTIALKPAGVYTLTITVQDGGTAITSNYLKLTTDTHGATLSLGKTKNYEIVNSKILPTGAFDILLDYGNYYYRLEHRLYETLEGTISVDASTDVKELKMTPAYSYLDISSTPDGAIVSIDGIYVGTTPLKIKEKLPTGNIAIELQKDMYHTKEILYSVPGDTLRHHTSVTLEPQFGTITCTSEDHQAELWLDQKYVGTGSWTGQLSSIGTHSLEARKKGHRSKHITFKVKDGEVRTYTVAGPDPIYGILEVVSVPSGATVCLDGKEIGITPFILNNVISEDHLLTLSKDGYIPKEDTIYIKPNEHIRLDYQMVEGEVESAVTITTNNSQTEIYISGLHVGKGSWNGKLTVGEYTVKTTLDGCRDAFTTLTVDGKGSVSLRAANPEPIVGQIYVSSNVKSAFITLENTATGYTIHNYTPETFSVRPGEYTVTLSKAGYRNTAPKTFPVIEGKVTEAYIRMKKAKKIRKSFNMSSNFIEMTYGYGLDLQEFTAGSRNYVGLNYGYLKSRVGMHTSLSVGIENQDVSFSIGPSLRLSPRNSMWDFQIYAAPSISYSNKPFQPDPIFNHSHWHLMGDAGLRIGLDGLYGDDINWATLSLGCRFSGSQIVPTAGISIFPVAFALGEDEYGDYACNFLDMLTGLYSDEMYLGASYSWIRTHLGVYGSFMIGLEDSDNFMVSAGPVFRLTTNSVLDLQLYGGPAYVIDEFGGDVGLRFAWETVFNVSLWDFSIGCAVSNNHVIPYISLGIGLSLMGGWIAPVAVYAEL